MVGSRVRDLRVLHSELSQVKQILQLQRLSPRLPRFSYASLGVLCDQICSSSLSVLFSDVQVFFDFVVSVMTADVRFLG